MKKMGARRLTLNRETVTKLEQGDLRDVAGGLTQFTSCQGYCSLEASCDPSLRRPSLCYCTEGC